MMSRLLGIAVLCCISLVVTASRSIPDPSELYDEQDLSLDVLGSLPDVSTNNMYVYPVCVVVVVSPLLSYLYCFAFH